MPNEEKDNAAQKESVSKDVGALKEAGYDTSDVGKGTRGAAKESAELTGSSSKEAARAGHDARDDMSKDPDMGVPADRHGDKDED